ncbi:hypothetical protein Pan44_00310 [Caulifigura coniformis]|uniref:DUF2007 domain-containing protein n=1 Tax=Caulifigura coniformis TaxID=2527983 RepID=A0A517S7B8_9PLAN|nr:DUF2007 domain-containing protein [Caulifigura coniformis]QDT52024.1 hypothetical protein Pan44_00310 [Caulifigura coniformis]
MSSDLIEVARPPYLSMAEEMRLFLEQHDIEAVFDNTNMGAMMPHLGTAIGVSVLVARPDAVRASQLLEQRRPVAATTGPWYCGACKVDVEPGFEACWSCGQARAEVEQPFPEGHAVPSPGVEPEDAVKKQKAEDLIQRAWRTALLCFGVIPLPVIGHLYSLMLLLESTGLGVQVSPDSRRLFLRTLFIDLAVLGVFVALLTALSFR